MFGLSIGEIVLLPIVGIVVVGPKNLPTMMRTAGQWVTRLRRMSNDLRSQSGIDDIIRHEGLEKEIQELRSLSRMNVVESLIAPGALQPMKRAPMPAALPAVGGVADAYSPASDRIQPLREREYPLIGCDAGGALADDTLIYHHAPADPALAADEPVALSPAADEPEALSPAASEDAPEPLAPPPPPDAAPLEQPGGAPT